MKNEIQRSQPITSSGLNYYEKNILKTIEIATQPKKYKTIKTRIINKRYRIRMFYYWFQYLNLEINQTYLSKSALPASLFKIHGCVNMSREIFCFTILKNDESAAVPAPIISEPGHIARKTIPRHAPSGRRAAHSQLMDRNPSFCSVKNWTSYNIQSF